MKSAGQNDLRSKDVKKYSVFLEAVVSSGCMWAIWCGETWATAADPTGQNVSLFLLWDSKDSAEKSLRANLAKFPVDAVVESIDKEKWLERYSAHLIEMNASVFINPDIKLQGLIVSPSDLARDLNQASKNWQLQGTDLNRLRHRLAQTKGCIPDSKK